VEEAQYAALLARAVPSLTLEQILGSPVREVPDAVPLARGWALIHASCLLHGEPMVWPEQTTETGARYMEAVERALTLQRQQRLRSRNTSQ
jgi:hypothetical protein